MTPTKLPVFATVRAAIADAVRVFQAMPAAIGLLFCAFLIMHVVAQAMIPDPLNVRIDLALFYSTVTASALLALVSAPVAVLIHRRIVLGENTGLGSAPALVREIFRFYLVLLALRIASKLMLIPAALDEGSGAMMAAALILWIGAIYLFVRLTTVFPAIAVGARPNPIRSGWRASRGVFWRIVAIGLLAGLPLILGFKALGPVVKAATPHGGLIDLLLQTVGSTIWLVALAAIASRIYLFRIGESPAGRANAADAPLNAPAR